MYRKSCLLIVTAAALVVAAVHVHASPVVNVPDPAELPQLALGRDKIRSSVEGIAFDKTVTFTIDPTLGKEAYALEVGGQQITIRAGDGTGAMYGAFELAEQIQFVGVDGIQSKSESPANAFRAIKFNLPWSSYRQSPALQLHMETCKDLKFWESFLDMMAQNRFNALTLWNLHPFPYMVCPKSFPEVAEGRDAELEQWKTFYHSLFKMAKDRGIETYIVNWNIFVDPAVSRKYGILEDNIDHHFYGDTQDSDLVRNYNRECVTQVIDEYPNLTGLGFSLGERMGGLTPAAREQWALDVIVGGIQDAKRKVKLIHRVPFSGSKHSSGSMDSATEKMTRNALERIDGVEEPILVEIKFNWSHAHSSPKLVKVHGGAIDDTYWNPEPGNYAITWMARNEDFFCLRWGAPDFIREHIRVNSKAYVAGYFIGSECYIPAVDYFTRQNGPLGWDYAFERQWAFYQQWGRLLYNPDTSDDLFRDHFVARYGCRGADLQQAVALASEMPLLLGCYFDLSWDFTLYSEGFLSFYPGGPTRHIDLDHMIHTKTLDPSFMNIADYVQRSVVEGKTIYDLVVTPVELADQLDSNAAKALQLIEGIPAAKASALFYELEDVKIWSELSQYFASKLRAGIAYESATLGSDKRGEKVKAIAHMQKAVEHWKKVIEITQPLYKPMPLVHLNNRDNGNVYFHWADDLDAVEADLETIRDL